MSPSTSRVDQTSLLQVIAATGFLTVATQLQSKELMQMIAGQTLQGEIFVIATVYTGFLLGFVLRLSRQLKAALCMLAVFFEITLCFFYGPTIELALSSSVVGVVIFAMSTMMVMLPALLMVELIYEDTFNMTTYTRIQKFALITAVLVLALALMTDKPVLCFLMAVGFLVSTLFILKSPGSSLRHLLKWDGLSIEAVAWGMASGAMTNYFFTLNHSMIYPTGLEFYFYNIILFFFLYLSAKLHNQFNLKIKLFKGYLLSTAIFFVLTTLFVSVNSQQKFYFDSLALTSLPIISFYPIFVFLILIALMIPYLMVSFTVPVLQSENQKNNFIFFTTLGSCLAQYLFLIPQLSFSLSVRFQLILLFVLLAFAVQYRRQQAQIGYSFMTLLLIGGLTVAWPDLEPRLISQAQRFHHAYWIPIQFRENMVKQGYSFKAPDVFKRIGTKIGALGGSQEYLKLLTFDGYSAETYLPHDYIKAALVEKSIKQSKPHRILLLGLGNHIVLKKIAQSINLDTQVDVVDNSIFFDDASFLKTVAAEASFVWGVANIKLHTQDALHFMYSSRDRYDLIVWNLTLPNYIDSIPLFSSEFALQMRNHLESAGQIVLPFYQNAHFDCVSSQLYQSIEIFKTIKPLSIAILNAGQGEPSDQMKAFNNYCQKTKPIDLTSQLQERQFYLATMRQDAVSVEYVKSHETDDIFDPIQNLNRSTILEKNNASPSLIINAPLMLLSPGADSKFLKSVREQKLYSVGWFDNYAEPYEFNKIGALLNFYFKDQTTILQISPEMSESKIKLRKGLKNYELALDDSSFWTEVFERISPKGTLLADGDAVLLERLRRTLAQNNRRSFKTGSYGGEDVVILAPTNKNELRSLSLKYQDLMHSQKVKFILWSAPWTEIGFEPSLPLWAQVGWPQVACASTFWTNLIENMAHNQMVGDNFTILATGQWDQSGRRRIRCQEPLKILRRNE